jgi:hypothetical protein
MELVNNAASIFIFNEEVRRHDLGKIKKGKAVPLHAMEALGGRGDIAPTHSQPRH